MNLGWLLNPDILKFLAGGLGMTLALASISIVLSFGAGMLLALGRLARPAWVRIPATIYIEGMRALPVFLIILFAYLALPKLIGFRLSPFVAGVVALSTFTAALVAEIIRAGILAVPTGVVETAIAQGFSARDRLRFIVMPIALRQMTPALTAQFVTLLKDTSLTAVIGNLELLRRAQIINAQPPFAAIPTYILVALTYFLVNYTISRLSRRLETRAAR
jgi:putative glutamine transport system permease protein